MSDLVYCQVLRIIYSALFKLVTLHPLDALGVMLYIGTWDDYLHLQYAY